jgi:hypothetical protein
VCTQRGGGGAGMERERDAKRVREKETYTMPRAFTHVYTLTTLNTRVHTSTLHTMKVRVGERARELHHTASLYTRVHSFSTLHTTRRKRETCTIPRACTQLVSLSASYIKRVYLRERVRMRVCVCVRVRVICVCLCVICVSLCIQHTHTLLGIGE